MSPSSSSVTAVFAPALFRGGQVPVSGAPSGIGLDVAHGFAALGRVHIRRGQPGFQARHAARRSAKAGICFARLDVLVNAAGIARPQADYASASVPRGDERQPPRVDALCPGGSLQAQGRIINHASMPSCLADADLTAHCTSKTGLLGLTPRPCLCLASQGIRVSAVTPGQPRDRDDALSMVAASPPQARPPLVRRWSAKAS